MEIENLTTGRATNHTMRVTIIVLTVVFSLSFVGLNFYNSKLLAEANNRVFIMESNGNMSAASGMTVVTKKDMELMAEDHVRDFYNAFFAFDEVSFTGNTERGLRLIGKSGVELFQNYKRDHVQERIAEANAIVSIQIESVVVEVKNLNSIRAKVQAIQITTSGKYQIARRMDSNVFDLIVVTRSIENPHGLRIENFIIEDKSEIKLGDD